MQKGRPREGPAGQLRRTRSAAYGAGRCRAGRSARRRRDSRQGRDRDRLAADRRTGRLHLGMQQRIGASWRAATSGASAGSIITAILAPAVAVGTATASTAQSTPTTRSPRGPSVPSALQADKAAEHEPEADQQDRRMDSGVNGACRLGGLDRIGRSIRLRRLAEQPGQIADPGGEQPGDRRLDIGRDGDLPETADEAQQDHDIGGDAAADRGAMVRWHAGCSLAVKQMGQAGGGVAARRAT
jgi:hypothetical protein